ncbi:unnamed protein product [Prunus armeniaca]
MPNWQINMISTISCRPTLVGTSNRSMKSYVCAAYYPQVFGIENARHNKVPKIQWEAITFYEEEEEEIIFPHDDPMIIRAEVANFYVGLLMKFPTFYGTGAIIGD